MDRACLELAGSKEHVLPVFALGSKTPQIVEGKMRGKVGKRYLNVPGQVLAVECVCCEQQRCKRPWRQNIPSPFLPSHFGGMYTSQQVM